MVNWHVVLWLFYVEQWRIVLIGLKLKSSAILRQWGDLAASWIGRLPSPRHPARVLDVLADPQRVCRPEMRFGDADFTLLGPCASGFQRLWPKGDFEEPVEWSMACSCHEVHFLECWKNGEAETTAASFVGTLDSILQSNDKEGKPYKDRMPTPAKEALESGKEDFEKAKPSTAAKIIEEFQARLPFKEGDTLIDEASMQKRDEALHLQRAEEKIWSQHGTCLPVGPLPIPQRWPMTWVSGHKGGHFLCVTMEILTIEIYRNLG